MANEIQFLLYNMPEEEGKVQVVIKDDTIWCTQKAMAQLFDIDKSGISRHIANIYKDGELSPDTTVAKIATVVNRGIRGEVEELVDFYNLDMIISVGYRVNSTKATRFRQWATKILNEYIRKGFVLDDDRLKQGTAVFGKDYFRELLEGYVPFVRVNGASGNRLRIFTPNAVQTMTVTLRQQKSFTQWCKIASTMRLPGRRQQKSFIQRLTIPKNTWG